MYRTGLKVAYYANVGIFLQISFVRMIKRMKILCNARLTQVVGMHGVLVSILLIVHSLLH